MYRYYEYNKIIYDFYLLTGYCCILYIVVGIINVSINVQSIT